MQQRWWIAVVAALGIGLAVLLFWPPSDGGKVDGATAGGPAGFEGGAPVNGAAAINPNVGGRRDRPPLAPPGANLTAPGEAEQVAKRARPESIYASKLVSPFSAIRYALAQKGTPEAKALIEEIGTMMGDLRTMRQEPDTMPWSALQAKTDGMVAKVAASPWGSDEIILKAVDRYQAFLAEYEVAKAAGAAAPAAPATPAQGEEAQ